MTVTHEHKAEPRSRIVGCCNLPCKSDVKVVEYDLAPGKNYFSDLSAPVIWGYTSSTVSEVHIGRFTNPRKRYRVGDLRLTRPGLEIVRVLDSAATMRALVLPEAAFEDVLGDEARKVEPAMKNLAENSFRSAMIEMLIDRLGHAEKRSYPKLFCQSLVHSLIFEIWRITGEIAELKQNTEQFSQAALDRIDHFVMDETPAKVDLKALASIAGMPVSAFARAFKAATGKTPYQHVVALRLKKARDLITSTTLSLAEIAYKSGFSSQSHMTDLFASKLGTTPGALRKG